MKYLPDVFERNRRWAEARIAEDPGFFARLAHIQRPDLLWIGCSDSRVPANEIVGLAPGELFVHRNVANIVPATDLNALAVVEYAVNSLGVRHIVVCGHYHCGGVKAALEGHQAGAVALWLQPLRNLADEHRAELDALASDDARWDRLCELNVAAQVAGAGADGDRRERLGARRRPRRARLDLRPRGRPAARPRGHRRRSRRAGSRRESPGRADGRRRPPRALSRRSARRPCGRARAPRCAPTARPS